MSDNELGEVFNQLLVEEKIEKERMEEERNNIVPEKTVEEKKYLNVMDRGLYGFIMLVMRLFKGFLKYLFFPFVLAFISITFVLFAENRELSAHFVWITPLTVLMLFLYIYSRIHKEKNRTAYIIYIFIFTIIIFVMFGLVYALSAPWVI